jgi:hypothetical protein
MQETVTVELVLTSEQHEHFTPPSWSSKRRPRNSPPCLLAHSYAPEANRGVIRLQAKLVGWKTARKAVKLLRNDKLDQA